MKIPTLLVLLCVFLGFQKNSFATEPISVSDIGQTAEVSKTDDRTLEIKERKYVLTGIGGYRLGEIVELKGTLTGRPGTSLLVNAINGKELKSKEYIYLGSGYKHTAYEKECIVVGYQDLQMMKEYPNMSFVVKFPKDFADFMLIFHVQEIKTPETLQR